METARYNSVAIVLHWAIALIIIGQFAGGLYMHGLPNSSPIKFDLYQLHKSFGLSVLFLVVIRLAWRLTHKIPALPAAMPGWQKLSARTVHWGFYVLMIMTPLAGWAIVSVSPTDIPTRWFGVFTVPHLPFFGGDIDRKAMEDLMEERHELLAKLIIALLVLHLGAALKHLFVNKDGVMTSMIPPRKRHWMGFGAIVAVLAAGVAFYFASPTPNAAAQSVMPDRHHEAGVQTAGGWVVDKSASTLKFSGAENGKPFSGAFSDFDASITFDPNDLAAARVSVTVNTATATTGDSLRDSNLPGSEWFDVRNHPAATYAANGFRAAGGGYAADGVLTIKGYDKPVTIAFTIDMDDASAVARGGADLIRTDFGLGAGSEWLNDEGLALEVRVDFDIRAVRQE